MDVLSKNIYFCLLKRFKNNFLNWDLTFLFLGWLLFIFPFSHFPIGHECDYEGPSSPAGLPLPTDHIEEGQAEARSLVGFNEVSQCTIGNQWK